MATIQPLQNISQFYRNLTPFSVQTSKIGQFHRNSNVIFTLSQNSQISLENMKGPIGDSLTSANYLRMLSKFNLIFIKTSNIGQILRSSDVIFSHSQNSQDFLLKYERSYWRQSNFCKIFENFIEI